LKLIVMTTQLRQTEATTMSDVFYKFYQEAEKVQHDRSEARRIRTKVDEARRSPHIAGIRWPFELLQNAIDAGPRPGRTSVTVQLIRETDRVVFAHDGAPFTPLELAALVSGGSSKEFESEETTGRFGTGFLVTHVLAERTNLQGLSAVDGAHELFNLALDRAGDEDAILKNIYTCREAIRAAELAPNITDIPSARFGYLVRENETFALGFDAFRRALPYLYGTRQQLGIVTIALPDGAKETWTPTKSKEYQIEEAWIQERNVQVLRTSGVAASELRVVRVTHEPDRHAAAVVVLERAGETWRVKVPEVELPRAFRDYPVRAATFLPINFVIDAKFSVDQERSRILMDESDKSLIKQSLKAATGALKVACREQWVSRHWLVKAANPATGFVSDDAAESQWWQEALSDFARDAAIMPIVETSAGCLPALSETGSFADFVFPRLLPTSPAEETTIARLWPLVEAAQGLYPPILSLASDWTLLAEGWSGLGLQMSLVSVKQLGTEVKKLGAEEKGKATRIEQLTVDMAPSQWLAEFIDIVGECWQRRDGIDQTVLEGLFPNQNGLLCSALSLHRDGGISEEIKNICCGIGLDLRAGLLTKELLESRHDGELQYLASTLAKAIPRELTEEMAIGQCVAQLEKILPADSKFTEKQRSGLNGSIQLIAYLRRTKNENGEGYGKRLPLVTEDLSITRWSKERMLMAPKEKWHKDAQPFSAAYPEGRLLVADYAGTELSGKIDVLAALVAWGICFADPLTRGPVELKDRRLKVLAIDPSSADGVTVSGEELVQIALLQPEVLNRCQEGPDEARALLGLAICYMARHDHTWRQVRRVKGRKGGDDKELEIRGALWLADLAIRAWVPVPMDESKFTKAAASQATLQNLIVPAWLPGNDDGIALLSEWFGFDELELRLLGTAPEKVERQKLRDGLAKVVEIAGGDPAAYEAIAQQLEENQRRARDVNRCRKLGIAIQEAVKAALEARDPKSTLKLKLTLEDRGFDYRVDVHSDDALADAAFRFNVGSYMLEVKATTHGDARLTPLQAETASTESAKYVLCVVDLRGIPRERLDRDWAGSDVEPLAKIVTGIGDRAKQTCVLVERAKAQAVGIRNEAALRYLVPVSVWTEGCSISAWVNTIAGGGYLWDPV